jgi:hypothetical protein
MTPMEKTQALGLVATTIDKAPQDQPCFVVLLVEHTQDGAAFVRLGKTSFWLSDEPVWIKGRVCNV